MRRLIIAALLLGCLGCDSSIPNYVLTPPTTPTPSPTPTPPPNPLPNGPADLRLTIAVGPTSPTAGVSASFTANVSPTPTAPVTYAWNFGDGATRTVTTESTFYAYGRAGAYDTSVAVADGLGRSVSGSVHVNVLSPPPPPAPDPPAPPTPDPTLTAALTCTPKAPPALTPCNVTASFGPTTLPGTSVTQVDWDWGDGATNLTLTPTAPTASHAYPTGTFTLFAKVTANQPTTPPSSATVTISKVLTIP